MIVIVCPVYGQSPDVRDLSQHIISTPTLYSFGPDIPSAFDFRNRFLDEGLGATDSDLNRIRIEIEQNVSERERISRDLLDANEELAIARELSAFSPALLNDTTIQPRSLSALNLTGRETTQRNLIHQFVNRNGTKINELLEKISELDVLITELNKQLEDNKKDNADLQKQLKNFVEKKLEMDKKSILIEAKIISIDTSDDRTLGVEISGGNRGGTNSLFAFSSFGLSKVSDKGSLSIDPSNVSGLNGVLVNPDTADVIVRALAQNTHVKVESSPRVLAKNAKQAVVMSTLGTPYEATLSLPNLGVAEEKFGGYATSGTVIDVIPEVLKNDKGQEEIHLKFVIRHSNNINSPKDKLPPAIHADVIQSQVKIPDKHTVIVGGLNRYGTTKEQHGIPGLMHIPLIKHIASYQKDSHSRTTLFFFITATTIDHADNTGKFDKLKYVNTQIHGLNLLPME